VPDQTGKNDTAQDRAEFNALIIETIQRIQKGETIKQASAYARLMERLEARAAQMEAEGIQIPLKDVSDWLALALFMDDRDRFEMLCTVADHRGYTVYRRARPWIEKLLEHETDTKK